MAALAPQDLLTAWQRGQRQPPLERALTLLAAAEPDAPRAGLGQRPIGDRDRALLAAYGATFGERLEGLAQCRACGEPIEIACRSGDLIVAADPAPACVRAGGYQVQLRTPASDDIAAATRDDADLERGADPERGLVERCVVACTLDGAPAAACDLPPELMPALSQAMLDHDPMLDLEFAATCPACGSDQTLGFDIATFLWQRVDARARTLLTQVHLLASTYGWSEAEILALPSARRDAYLALVTE